MRPIEILIGHDHDGAISQALHTVIPVTSEWSERVFSLSLRLPRLESDDLKYGLDFLVVNGLLIRRLSHIQHFTSQREHPIPVFPIVTVVSKPRPSYLSRPITPSPATAKALAESPSVRIRVHRSE